MSEAARALKLETRTGVVAAIELIGERVIARIRSQREDGKPVQLTLLDPERGTIWPGQHVELERRDQAHYFSIKAPS